MSLIGQLPLAAIWFFCKDLEQSKRFYKEIVGLKPIEVIDELGRVNSSGGSEAEDGGIHFDLGNVRLSLLPRPGSSKSTGGNNGNGDGETVQKKAPTPDHLVFVVENHMETVVADLQKRGVKVRSKRIIEDSSGKAVWFDDPDGRIIYLWQPPRRESKNFKDVEVLVHHYESVSRALADLREEDTIIAS